MPQKCYSNCLLWTRCVHWMLQWQAPWRTNTHTWQHQTSWNVPMTRIAIDTEASMLSRIFRKRNTQSNPDWITEFCKLQCLSHFFVFLCVWCVCMCVCGVWGVYVGMWWIRKDEYLLSMSCNLCFLVRRQAPSTFHSFVTMWRVVWDERISPRQSR